jgi:hypothetical protein
MEHFTNVAATLLWHDFDVSYDALQTRQGTPTDQMR